MGDKTYFLDIQKTDKKIDLNVSEYDRLIYAPKTLSEGSNEMKKAFTVDEMINKMKQHNWKFEGNEDEDCRTILREVNYYTFSFYGRRYGLKKYSEIKKQYYFDVFFRNWLQDITSDIEMFLKTITLDSLCLEAEISDGIRSQFFLYDDIYFSETGKHKRIKPRIEEVDKVKHNFYLAYLNHINNANIVHNMEKYNGISAWVLFNSITFGQYCMFFSKLNTHHKNLVAKRLCADTTNNRISGEILASWMNSIRYLRNLVSHGTKVYGESMTTLPKEHIKDKVYIGKLEKKDRVSMIMLVMKRLIMCMSKEQQTKWDSKIDILEFNINSNSIYLNDLGFTSDWKNILKIHNS